MKKLSQYILSIMLSLFIIPFGNVHAESLDVQTINASITDNKISVDGTVDNGVLAVAIMVYEEDGTTLVKMETTSVDSNDKYSDTIVVYNPYLYQRIWNSCCQHLESIFYDLFIGDQHRKATTLSLLWKIRRLKNKK